MRDARKGVVNEEEFEKVEIRGIPLESLANPTFNLAAITKLDLSKTNLEVFLFFQLSFDFIFNSLYVNIMFSALHLSI